MSPGYDLDGTSDYLLNSNVTGIYNNTYQTIVVAFKPDFAYNDNVFHYFFDSTSGSRYNLAKSNTAGSYALLLYFGNTGIASITISTYSPYWKQHGINILIVSGTSGNNNVWLNGFQILINNTTSWSAAASTSIWLGSSYASSLFFDGEILHFSTYSILFSPTQARFLTSYLMAEYS